MNKFEGMSEYEVGYEEGESSGFANWVLALDVLPFDVTEPDDVIAAVTWMVAELEKIGVEIPEKFKRKAEN